ncbi:MAG: peptide chain release factor N(5)-glutamine methyltransferase [Anaerolineae bacterium]
MGDLREARSVGEAMTLARRLYRESVSHITMQALLAHITGHDRAWLLAHAEAGLTASQAGRFAELMERAAQGEPLAYLTGEREFAGLAFHVEPGVLVPRPETEEVVNIVVRWAANRAAGPLRVIDVGTGSGIIAVTLALRLPQAQITASDISADALRVAGHNARRHGVIDRITFVQGDLLTPFPGPFEVIAANLPYIASDELALLDVGRWEPEVALDGGADGLEIVRRLLEQAPSRLVPGGLLVLEIGYNQGAQAAAVCQSAFPKARVRVERDLAKLERIVVVET